MSNDQFFESIVTINQGSGVLVNPQTEHYSYIYTAKHVISIDPDDKNSPILSLDKIQVHDKNGYKISIIDVLIKDCSDLDIAILQTSKKENSAVCISRTVLSLGDKVRFCGYPGEYRELPSISDRYRNHSYEFDVSYPEHSKLKPTINIDYKKIVGMSGGGIFDDIQGLLLRAIETRYSGAQNEYDGCINAVNICKFDEIIHYKNISREIKLSLVLPSELQCFNSLEKLTFDFPEGWDRPQLLSNIRKLLISIGLEGLTSVNITPLTVKKELEFILKCDFYEKFELNEPKYWAAFFELIVISVIIDEPIEFNQEYLKQILRKRRVIYINSEKTWHKHVMSIINHEYIEHDDNGFLIVKTNRTSQRVLFDSELIENIYIDEVNNPYSFFEIDEAQQNKNLKKTLIDLAALNSRCVYEKQEELALLNIVKNKEEIKEKIKINYSVYLKDECK